MINPLNSAQVRDTILKKGYEATEATDFFWRNTTEALANTSKSALTAQCGSRVGFTDLSKIIKCPGKF